MENPLLQFEPGLMIWTVIVFVITLLVLHRIAWKPLLGSLDDREKRIDDALSRADRAQQEAEKAIAQAKEESKEALRRSDEMVKQAKLEGEKLREKILEEAKAERQKIVAEGLKQLEVEQRHAFEEIRRETVGIAIQAASKLVESQMDEAQQRRLVDDFLRDLPADRVQ